MVPFLTLGCDFSGPYVEFCAQGLELVLGWAAAVELAATVDLANDAQVFCGGCGAELFAGHAAAGGCEPLKAGIVAKNASLLSGWQVIEFLLWFTLDNIHNSHQRAAAIAAAISVRPRTA